MKVLVATRDSQGFRANDFCHSNNGEILVPGFVCCKDAANADGVCGCNRSLIGIDSGRATTTIKVVETSLSEAELLDELGEGVKKMGLRSAGFLKAELRRWLRVAGRYAEGEVLEYRSGALLRRNMCELQKTG